MQPISGSRVPTFLLAALAALGALLPPSLSAMLPLSEQAGPTFNRAGNSHRRLESAYFTFPLSFEANLGQADPQVSFLARGPGYKLLLGSAGAEIVLRPVATQNPLRDQGAVVRMRLDGGQPHARAHGLEELAGKVNYLLGPDPQLWRTGIPTFAKARFEDVYPGIDVLYYGAQGQLEFDFVVSPGAEPGTIGLRFEGPETAAIDDNGDLRLDLSGRSLRFRRPLAFQEIDGQQVTVACRYHLRVDGSVGFDIPIHDRARELVIDPVLIYSTYLGGSGDERAFAVAVDENQNVYVAGDTTSADFPTNAALQTTPSGTSDVFVSKISSDGSTLIYSTYLGGSGDDAAYGLAVDSSGNAYLTGVTTSADFPTLNAFQAVFGGAADAFITKLDPSGSALVYSSFLGGAGTENAEIVLGERVPTGGIAIDAGGNAYVTGSARTGFPQTGPLQFPFGGGVSDAFVAKVNAAGSMLAFSTLLGGTGDDRGHGIALDPLGNVYLTGIAGQGYPTTPGAFQLSAASTRDAFITKLSGDGSALLYSTFLGGSNDDQGWGIAVNEAGSAFVTGRAGLGFPTTPDALDPLGFGVTHSFVTKLSADGSTLLYSTFLGNFTDDTGYGVTVDDIGNAYVTGVTRDNRFPTQNPVQADCSQGLTSSCRDAFVTKLDPTGSAVLFSSYLGGTNTDNAALPEEGRAIALDADNNIYVAGFTISTDFPLLNPLQPATGGALDAFLVRISPSIQFSAVNFVVSETVGQAEVTVQSDGVAGRTTVDVSTSDGTALAGPDYMAASETITFGDKEAGEKTFTVLIVDDTDTEGNETVDLALSAPTGKALLGDPSNATLTILDNETNLSLFLSDSPDPTTAGLDLTYSMSVFNRGPGTATGIVVTVDLPAEVQFVSATISQGGSCSGTTTITCSVATLPPSLSVGISIVVIPVDTGEIVATASVSQDGADSDPADNTAATTTTVNSSVPVISEISPVDIQAGGPEFALTVTGQGFLTTSIVRWNGNDRATTFVSPTELTATILASDIAAGGVAEITVVNAGPNGGTSNVVPLDVIDFSFSASPATASIAAGQSATFTLSVASQNGTFASPVSFSCSGLPSLTLCSFAPATVTPGVDGDTSILSIVTTAPALTLPEPVGGTPPSPLLLLAFTLTAALLLAVTRRWAKHAHRWALAGCLSCLLLLLAGCAGGGAPDIALSGTPRGAHTVTVAATSGSLTRTATVVVNVQ